MAITNVFGPYYYSRLLQVPIIFGLGQIGGKGYLIFVFAGCACTQSDPVICTLVHEKAYWLHMIIPFKSTTI